MKALFFMGFIFSAFLIILGYSSKETAGDVLGNTVIIGGVLILVFMTIIGVMMFLKEKRGK